MRVVRHARFLRFLNRWRRLCVVAVIQRGACQKEELPGQREDRGVGEAEEVQQRAEDVAGALDGEVAGPLGGGQRRGAREGVAEEVLARRDEGGERAEEVARVRGVAGQRVSRVEAEDEVVLDARAGVGAPGHGEAVGGGVGEAQEEGARGEGQQQRLGGAAGQRGDEPGVVVEAVAGHVELHGEDVLFGGARGRGRGRRRERRRGVEVR